MTRVVLSLAVLMLLGAGPAHAQCYPVTVSGSAVFKKHLSAAERRAAGSEARRRGCSQKPVPNDTPGAIDGETAISLMPMIKAKLAEQKLVVARVKIKTATRVKVRKERRAKRHKGRVVKNRTVGPQVVLPAPVEPVWPPVVPVPALPAEPEKAAPEPTVAPSASVIPKAAEPESRWARIVKALKRLW